MTLMLVRSNLQIVDERSPQMQIQYKASCTRY